MRQYETAFLIAPNLPEEDNEKLISQMAEVVSKKKGKMINVDEWGKRKLAYSIQKFEEAYYVFFLYEGNPSIPEELERRFKQTETIIRYLTVKNEITEIAKKRGRAPTKKKRETADLKEEKSPKKIDVPAEAFIEDLEKEPEERVTEIPTEESRKAQKLEAEEGLEKKAKAEQDKKLKAKSKEEPKAEPKEKRKEVQSVEIVTEPEEEPGEKPEKDTKTEPKVQPDDKDKEKSQENLPPEGKEKKEK